MAQEDIEQKIKLSYETNADETSTKVNDLSSSLDKTDTAQAKVTKTTKETTEAHKKAAAGSERPNSSPEFRRWIGQTITGMKDMLKQMWLIKYLCINYCCYCWCARLNG
jgi:hypothetical protein